MTIALTKKTAEVIRILETIMKEVKSSIKNVNDDITENFNLEVIKNTVNYCLDSIKLKVFEIIQTQLEKLNWYDVLIDCGEIDNELKEIEEAIILSRKKIDNKLNQENKTINFKINVNEITRKIHLLMPISWGKENLEKYNQEFLRILNEKRIVEA